MCVVRVASTAAMPVRAGWVPCVGFQPLKPMMMVINEADAIASECERAFQMVRPEEQQEGLAPSSESPLHLECMCS